MWQNLTPFDEAIYINTDSLVLIQYHHGKHLTGTFYSQKKLTLSRSSACIDVPNVQHKHRFEQSEV